MHYERDWCDVRFSVCPRESTIFICLSDGRLFFFLFFVFWSFFGELKKNRQFVQLSLMGKCQPALFLCMWLKCKYLCLCVFFFLSLSVSLSVVVYIDFFRMWIIFKCRKSAQITWWKKKKNFHKRWKETGGEMLQQSVSDFAAVIRWGIICLINSDQGFGRSGWCGGAGLSAVQLIWNRELLSALVCIGSRRC